MSGSEEKSLKPSARKLRKARADGQIAQQRDTRLLLVTLGAILFLWSAAGDIARHFQDSAGLAFSLLTEPTQSYDEIIAQSVATGLRIFGTLFAIIFGVLVIGSIVLNGGMVFSLAPVTPKLSKLSPVQGFKRMFGTRALIEFAKALTRMLLAGAGIALVLWGWGGALLYAPSCGLGCLIEVSARLAAMVVGVVVAVSVLFAVIDLPVQAWLFQRDQNMTKTEMKNEMKDMNGSPEIRSALRRLRKEAANAKVSRLGLPRATLIIAGADEAVALRYVKAEYGIPVVVAKVRDPAKFAALVDQAAELGIPMMQDASLARRILKAARPGSPILPSEYSDTARMIQAAG